ncbi:MULTISPECIES: SDR family oxidoreductase [Bradyrhizobium]|jgi:NAD(P)-dependent dehydrogenase (short-subunit alcohol dehydrogenase family)|uniref:SDR family oxidoreductase n=1 Tax=Bradyrhizobium elkanii TaxID=29448 RepID=UPI000403E76A|nr:SDR family oxidoreductase [Bradyrhizobium elkanii]
MSGWSTADIPPQTGKTAVITGATGGLGYETALALAGAGATVVLTGRNDIKGRHALERIRAQYPNADVSYETLDLASLASVADFAGRFAISRPSVDLLINNAGVMALPKRRTTQDGFEMQLGINYLGHYALTARLLPQLRRGLKPRVVNLSSLAHRSGAIDFADLQSERSYRPWRAYCQSKLAMLIFALELQRRSDAAGWGLMSNAAHPGYARTDLIPNGPGTRSLSSYFSRLLQPYASQSAAAGALPTLFAATSPAAEPGGYYGPNWFYELKGPPVEAKIMPQAKDAAVAAMLWEASATLTGVSFDQFAAAA